MQIQSIEDRFWARVQISDGCWLWTGTTSRLYGMVQFQGRSHQAHRVAWLLTYGSIPDGLHVCHTCDNPPCVNPAHLWLGTRSDNLRDCVAKGRYKPPKPRQATCPRGHLWTTESRYVSIDRKGREHWHCRICRRIRRGTHAR